MINKLELRNFKKHKDLTLDFRAGFNGIFGGNYAGKTTVIYGILYALGGASAVPGTRIITRGSSAGLRVAMEFSIRDVEHKVVRTKTSANLHKGEELIATGVTGVNAAIEGLLGMPVKRFFQLRYAEQKETASMLTLGANDLHALLDTLTGVDTLSKAIDKLKRLSSDAAAQLEVLPEVPLEGLEEAMRQADIKRTTKSVEETHLLSEASNSSMFLQQQEADLKTLEVQAVEARKSHYAITRARELRDMQQAEVNTLRATADEFNDLRSAPLEETERKAAEAAERLASKREVEGLLSLSAAAGLGLATAEEELEVAAQEKADYPFEQEAHTGLLAALDDAKDDARKAKAKLKDFREALKSGACDSCGREYEGGASLEKLSTMVDEQKGANTRAQSLLEAAREAVEKSEVSKLAYGKLGIGVASKAAFLELARKGHAESLSNLEAASATNLSDLPIQELEAVSSRWVEEVFLVKSQAKATEEAIAALREGEVKLERVREDLTRAAEVYVLDSEKTAESAYQAKQKAVVEARAKAAMDNDLAYQAKSSHSAALAVLEAAQRELKHAEDRAAERGGILSRKATIVDLSKFLKSNRDRYSAGSWDFFMASASQFVSNCTDGAISEVVRTEDGKFEFVEDGHRMAIKEASGAQSAILGLGVKMALSRSIECPLDIVLVDEPTADMDAEHSIATLAILASEGAQVIGISHQDMDKSLCNHTISL